MVILAVDYGDVRTGLAVCDPLEMLASPVGVLRQTDAEQLCAEIAEIAAERKVERIVLGLPKNMDGTEGFRAESCRAFADLLAKKTGLSVELQDERLTTVSAHRALNMTDTRGKKRKAVVDAVSAVIILEDYLRRTKN